MKTVFLIFLICLVTTTIFSQNKSKNIGLRIAANGTSHEISYQSTVSENHRWEINLGFYNSTAFQYINDDTFCYGINTIYQWVGSFSSKSPGLKYYFGVGPSIRNYDLNDPLNPNNQENVTIYIYDRFGVGLIGQMGCEYNFKFPLQLSLDWRPNLYNTYTGFFESRINPLQGLAVGIRYKL
jgi:hypothetical protein